MFIAVVEYTSNDIYLSLKIVILIVGNDLLCDFPVGMIDYGDQFGLFIGAMGHK